MKRNLTIIVSVLLFGFALINTACSENEQSAKNDATEVAGEKDSKLNKKAVCNQEEADKGITFEITECIRAEIYEKDIELNEIYRKLMTKLSKEEGEKLKQSQLNWIKFKDSEQEFIYSTFDGTLIQIEGLSIYLETLKRRIDDIKSHLSKIEITRITD